MTSSLFLDAPLKIDGAEKLAGTLTRMGDNVDEWPQQVSQEAYKQIPYLSDFTADVILEKVDEQKGFAFGAIHVKPKSDMSLEEQEETSGLDKVFIPVVIKDNMLCSFDVFIHGKSYHNLTESRLRSALFRPDVMDAPRTRPFDPNLINDMMPPVEGRMGGSFGKLGAAEMAAIPLLPQLQGRVMQSHVDRLKTACEDPSLRMQVTNGDEGVKAAFQSAMGLSPTEKEKRASLLASSVRPNVVQIRRLDNGQYKVKWANTEMYAPQEESVPLDVAMDLAGEEDLSGILEADDTITASPDAPIKETMEAEEVKVADVFGLWKVQDTTGNTMIGWVFPQLLSMDMVPLPLTLFTNGSQYAVQEHVAGEMAGKSVDLPKGNPQGYGCLYYIDHGTAKAFVPMTVSNTVRGPDGLIKYMATDELGEQVNFYFSDAMKKVMKVGEGEYCVPAGCNWMPLRGKTDLISKPLAFSKTASRKFSSMGELLSDGALFTWRGPAVAHLPEEQTKFVKRADAEFLGVAMGLSPPFCKQALAKAAKGELMSFEHLKQVVPLREKMAAARNSVLKDLTELDRPIRNYFLAKEASLLDDALTADKILGLGFLNAENVATFVDMLPNLEATSSKLAEMLIAVRLGMKDVPEQAVERMLTAIEDVIQGLKALKHKELEKMQ